MNSRQEKAEELISRTEFKRMDTDGDKCLTWTNSRPARNNRESGEEASGKKPSEARRIGCEAMSLASDRKRLFQGSGRKSPGAMDGQRGPKSSSSQSSCCWSASLPVPQSARQAARSTAGGRRIGVAWPGSARSQASACSATLLCCIGHPRQFNTGDARREAIWSRIGDWFGRWTGAKNDHSQASAVHGRSEKVVTG